MRIVITQVKGGFIIEVQGPKPDVFVVTDGTSVVDYVKQLFDPSPVLVANKRVVTQEQPA